MYLYFVVVSENEILNQVVSRSPREEEITFCGLGCSPGLLCFQISPFCDPGCGLWLWHPGLCRSGQRAVPGLAGWSGQHHSVRGWRVGGGDERFGLNGHGWPKEGERWMVVVVSQFNGTSTPKGSYSAKTGDNDCNVNLSRYSLSTALCESNSLSGEVWRKWIEC